MILIISTQWDFHARAVQWALSKNGVACEILDFSEIPTKNHFAIELDKGGGWQLKSGGRVVELSAVRLVWCRKTPIGHGTLNYSGVHPLDLNNVVSEVYSCLRGLYFGLQAILKDVPWVNSYSTAESAESKLTQLVIARRLGLHVAPTLFSNDPSSIRNFHTKVKGGVVAKSFKQTLWEVNDRKIFQAAHPIGEQHLLNDAALQLCPLIYQEAVPKAYEVRILILGKKIVAAKINSQEHKHTMADWRLDAHKQQVGIEPHELTQETTQKLLALMDQLQISTGSVDMIVDKNGCETFLEVNQQGNFLFVEVRAPGIKLLQAFTDFLMENAGYSSNSRAIRCSEFLQSTDYAKIPALVEQATKAAPKIPYFVFKDVEMNSASSLAA